MTYAAIRAIEYFLPKKELTNTQLAEEFPAFSVEKIQEKTGISVRHLAESGQFASDMAICAANQLLNKYNLDRNEIDFIIFCTQTPDYVLPTSACLIQHALGLKHSVGAMDINLGCSGFVYGLSVAKGLIESNQAKKVLLLTGDTYSKLIEKTDHSVRTIFGDGAAATLISAVDEACVPCIAPVLFGTDGAGAMNLCVRGSGMRALDEPGLDPFLRMQGPDIFTFTLEAVPDAVQQLLAREGMVLSDIDLFVFHQANQYMLEHLRKKIRIPEEKFWCAMDFCGNTVSSSIPIALTEAHRHQRLHACKKIMLVGFGVGYSWAASIVNGEMMY